MENNANIKSIFSNTNESIKLNTDTRFKPLRSYFLYIILRVFKSISTLIILLLTFAATIFLSLLPIFFPEDMRDIVIRITPMVLSITLIIFSATFGIAKSLDLFLGFQAEGTELIIISKPISRNQILIVKFSFLFILGFIYSGLVTGFASIGFAVVGFADYESTGLNIQGIFFAVLLAYMIMGLLSIAISNANNTSDKLAKALPSLILSISATCSLFVPQLISMTNQNPSIENIQKFGTNLFLKSQKADLTFGGNKVSSIKLSSAIPFSYIKSVSSICLVGNLDVSYLNVIENTTNTITVSDFDFRNDRVPDNLEERKKIYEFATSIAFEEFNTNGLSINGQGWTAFNYINPISAFLSISGTNISFSSSREGLPYNYKFEGFEMGGTQKSSNGKYEYPATIIVKNAIKLDPQWALTLLWASIWISLGIFTVIAYHRRDFK